MGDGMPNYDADTFMDTARALGGEGSVDPFAQLTEREKQVALELARGSTNRAIAEWLDISIKTVDTHRGHLLKKLKLRNNVELCRLAIRVGKIAA